MERSARPIFLFHALMAALSLLCLLMISGCSDTRKAENAQVFFTAFNHLLEANSIDAKGDVKMGAIEGTYTFVLDQNDGIDLAYILQNAKDPSLLFEFFIKDGKTYLDAWGTKSQSIAKNIGIEPDSHLNLYNPFLDMNNEERADMFSSIEVKEDGTLYIMNLDKSRLGALLDPYGTAKVSSAVLTVRFQNKEIKTMDLAISGQIAAGQSEGPMNVRLSADVLSMNEKVTLPYPADLESYGK